MSDVFLTPSESAREHLRNAEALLHSWIMELARQDMTTDLVTSLAEIRDRVQAARELTEEVRALADHKVSAERAVYVYWKVRELL